MALWTTPLTWTNGAVTAATMNTEVRDHLNWLKGFSDLVTASTAADSGTATYMSITRPAGETGYQTKLSGGGAGHRWRVLTEGDMQWGDGTGTTSFYLTRANSNELRLVGAAIVVERSGSTNAPNFGAQLTGDTNSRVAIGTDSSDRGRIRFGPGNAATDAEIRRAGVGVLEVPGDTQLRFTGPGGAAVQIVFRRDTDTQPRFRGSTDGLLEWGGGGVTAPDTNLYRGVGGRLVSDGQLRGGDGLVTKTVTGVVADASFSVAPISGTLAVDTTNNRLYVRVGSTWRFVALT